MSTTERSQVGSELPGTSLHQDGDGVLYQLGWVLVLATPRTDKEERCVTITISRCEVGTVFQNGLFSAPTHDHDENH